VTRSEDNRICDHDDGQAHDHADAPDAPVSAGASDMDDGYFASMYRADPDPWGFDTRFYEQRKYDLTMAALPRSHYESGFEPGCSNGALTVRLASRCATLASCDIVESAVERSRARTSMLDHVHVEVARFPEQWPAGSFDLVVWSEVAYYLGDHSLDLAVRTLRERLQPDGDLVVVSYTGSTNYPQTAASVDERIEQCDWLVRHTTLRSESFQLGVWRRRSA